MINNANEILILLTGCLGLFIYLFIYFWGDLGNKLRIHRLQNCEFDIVRGSTVKRGFHEYDSMCLNGPVNWATMKLVLQWFEIGALVIK